MLLGSFSGASDLGQTKGMIHVGQGSQDTHCSVKYLDLRQRRALLERVRHDTERSPTPRKTLSCCQMSVKERCGDEKNSRSRWICLQDNRALVSVAAHDHDSTNALAAVGGTEAAPGRPARDPQTRTATGWNQAERLWYCPRSLPVNCTLAVRQSRYRTDKATPRHPLSAWHRSTPITLQMARM